MNKKLKYLIAFGIVKKLVMAAIFFAPSFGFSAEMEVVNAWARASVPGARAGAAYITLKSEEDDVLLSVSTEFARSAEIHATEDNDGIMSMEYLDKLSLPAGVEVGMAPGGYHIMLMGLKQDLKAGLELPITLAFKHSSTRHVRVPIKPLTYKVEAK
jgi:hypothetical protein